VRADRPPLDRGDRAVDASREEDRVRSHREDAYPSC
jgi:hypothetical protein